MEAEHVFTSPATACMLKHGAATTFDSFERLALAAQCGVNIEMVSWKFDHVRVDGVLFSRMTATRIDGRAAHENHMRILTEHHAAFRRDAAEQN
jgi:hypothetical protein